jgi:hypothetical protein
MSIPLWKPPKLPREHGAWAMLTLPLVLGVVGTGVLRTTTWALVVSCVLAFLAHFALVPVGQRRLAGRVPARSWWVRRGAWGVIYLLAALGAFVLTVTLTPEASVRSLLVVAATAVACATVFGVSSVIGSNRRAWSELIGMVGLSLSPALIALADGAAPTGPTFGPSVLSFAYFVSSLSFVRAYGAASKRTTVVALAIHVVLMVGLLIVAAAGWLAPLAPIAFLPLLIRTVWGLARPPASLRALGLREVAVAVSYAILASIAISI